MRTVHHQPKKARVGKPVRSKSVEVCQVPVPSIHVIGESDGDRHGSEELAEAATMCRAVPLCN